MRTVIIRDKHDDPRSQNVLKIKLEYVKLVELTKNRKKLTSGHKRRQHQIENSQAGRHGFDPRRPLKNKKINLFSFCAINIFGVDSGKFLSAGVARREKVTPGLAEAGILD